MVRWNNLVNCLQRKHNDLLHVLPVALGLSVRLKLTLRISIKMSGEVVSISLNSEVCPYSDLSMLLFKF
jgi:hypothetical protein